MSNQAHNGRRFERGIRSILAVVGDIDGLKLSLV